MKEHIKKNLWRQDAPCVRYLKYAHTDILRDHKAG